MSRDQKRGMAKPYEQDVILDADGRSLFSAMELFERKIAGIAKTIKNIERDSYKTAADLNKTLDANIKSLQKVQSQMNTLAKVGASARTQERTVAGRTAGEDVSRYGVAATKAKYLLDLEQKLTSLQYARTEVDRRNGIEAVRTAQARVRAIEQIEAAERRVTVEKLRQDKAENLSQQRAKLALSRQFAESEIRTLGTEEAIRVAKERQRIAEQRLAGATALTRNELRQNLELENARLRALERIAAQQRRMAGQASGGGGGPPAGPESRLKNILSPGYGAAAFARTSVYGAAAAAAYGTFNLVQGGLQGVVEFEDALKKLQAISGSTTSQMQILKGSIFELGRETRYSLIELAQASQILAQAGVSAGDMEATLRSVSTLAVASGSTIEESVQLVTSAVGAFQLQASETPRIADLMTEALNRTKLTVAQTGQAIQYVGATAFEQNISLEQLLATIGAVAQAGVKSGSTIGTGFRQFLVDLASPSKNLTEQLDLLGLKTSDVNVAVRGLPAVLDTLSKAGFGAAQAYQGLEVRAAAFYLIAKNNVQIMDQLQLAFAQSGSAINANEVAMSSLSAQWQRFKNIISSRFIESMEGPLNVIKEILRNISDSMDEIDKKKANEKKAWWEKDPSPYLEDFLEKFLNGDFNESPHDTKWGTILRYGSEQMDEAGKAAERMGTKVAESNDKITAQRNKLSELDRELLRIITQKDSLAKNETRVSAETATLTSRFQNLATQLTGTGTAYDDLVQAMKRYQYQEAQLLGIELQAQKANLTVQRASSRRLGNAHIDAFLGNSNFTKQAGANVTAALNTLKTTPAGTREFSNALNVVVDAVNRFANSNEDLSKRLNAIAQSFSTVAQNTANIKAINLESGQLRAADSEVGRFIGDNLREVQAAITQIASMANDQPEKKALSDRALGTLTTLDKKIEEVLKRSLQQSSRQFLLAAQTDITSLRKQITGLNTPTSDEKRAAEKAEREAAKGPKLTQAELDRLASQFLGAGFSLGSGVRSAAEQNALFRAGKTPADASGSSHSNGGLARDFKIASNVSNEQAKQLATALRNYFKNLGLDVFVQFETGKGKYQGTGRHIHVSAKKGTRFKGSDGGSDSAAMDQFAAAMDDAQLALDKRELNEALKDLANATTQEALQAAIGRTQAAMKKVQQDLRNKAENELSKAGVGPGFPQYQERMNQLNEEIAQMNSEYQRKLVDGILKGTKKTFEATITAFERKLFDAQVPVQLADAAAKGLNYASLQGRVPDYVSQLAANRTAKAQEAADRAKLDALPSVIQDLQNQITNLSSQMMAGIMSGTLTDPEEIQRVKDQIQGLTDKMLQLKMTKEELTAAFNAGNLIPTTFTDGLKQAFEAFNQLNGANRSFVEQVNGELGGAINQLHGGLSTLFSTVLTDASSAGSAALAFGRMIVQMITQIVAKIIATQIIKLLGQIFGAFGGGPVGGAGAPSGETNVPTPGQIGPFYQGGPVGYASGGHVREGHNMRDSVFAKLSKGEWVINRRAVDSVGHEFMADLNARGKTAVDSVAASGPSLNFNPKQEVNVWMVKPDEKPQLGPQDVLVVWQDDVLNNGQSRRLIESIARENQR